MWRAASCQVVGTTSLSDASGFVTKSKIVNVPPIDIFYSTTQELLRMCEPALLEDHEPLGSLITVGIVSAVENYFRDVFAHVLRFCPMSQSKSAEKSIQLGSVIWHRTGYVERGAFEHISFAGAKNVIETSRNFLGYEIKPNSAVAGALAEFDKVCEIRHGIVHSSSNLAGKNAVKLSLSSTGDALSIVMGYGNTQECALVCTNLVCSFNADIYVEMCRRWALVWPKMHMISPEEQKTAFQRIWNVFASKIDRDRKLLPRKMSKAHCMKAVKDEYS